MEVGVAANGEYPSVPCFINGLGRSNAFYVLDGLALVTSSTGELALNSRAHTYFRT